jgi:hypothetical protein
MFLTRLYKFTAIHLLHVLGIMMGVLQVALIATVQLHVLCLELTNLYLLKLDLLHVQSQSVVTPHPQALNLLTQLPSTQLPIRRTLIRTD